MLSLLGKDAREHATTALVLGAATLVVVLVALGQNRAAAFSMSPFEVVRFALLTYMPLVALIVGNRLVVREYLARTRLFVEALPVGSALPLFLKYVTGMLYLALLTLGLVLLAANAAGLADDVTGDYMMLLTGKSLALVSLYWSVVFCFSLCGHLRFALYLVTFGLVALIAYWPGIDQARFAPFALLDDQLFVFERDVVPWADLVGTLALSGAFTVAGFVLARLGEGAVAERLARPMTRTDHVAIAVLVVAGGAVAASLAERSERESIAFTSEATLRASSPPVAVLYGEAAYRARAEAMLARSVESLATLQAALGVSALPAVRVALAPELDPHDLQYTTLDGVFVRTNWLEHDGYDDAVLDAVILHGVLGVLSGDRAMFEPYHWVLDGLARWWAEGGPAEADSAEDGPAERGSAATGRAEAGRAEREAHESELVARALHVLGRAGKRVDLIDDWQLLADRFAYPGAEALAWSAMRYLELERGEETVLTLARAFFGEALGGNTLAALRDRRRPTRQRFADATGLDWNAFVAGWRTWLEGRAAEPGVQAFLAGIPPIVGTLAAGVDEGGVHHLIGGYRPLEGVTREVAEAALGAARRDAPDLRCVMKHDVIGPFDTEFDVDQGRDPRTRDVADCRLGAAVHDIGSRYAPGQRVYVAFDLEDGRFHQPLRLGARRVSLADESLAGATAGAIAGTVGAAAR